MNNNEMLLLKLGEVVLKGLNRRSFEDKLVSNVRRRMKHCGSFQVYIRQSTIYVEPQTEECDMDIGAKGLFHWHSEECLCGGIHPAWKCQQGNV